jgi:hypothetical protein
MDDLQTLGAATLPLLQDEWTRQWHLSSSDEPSETIPRDSGGPLTDLIQAQHRANFDLWHQEDEARNPDAPDARITQVKHAIDGLNQTRNDLVETIDVRLSANLTQAGASPLHSETPGMMIDRLSILALKIYHTREEALRMSASVAHREKNAARLATLTEQRTDLAGCLDALLAEVRAGTRRFKIYRQMKMYNDPELNPVLYNPGAQPLNTGRRNGQAAGRG